MAEGGIRRTSEERMEEVGGDEGDDISAHQDI